MVEASGDAKTTVSMQPESRRLSEAFTDHARIGTMGETTMSAVNPVARWRRAFE
jgi:hypothetical protein